MYRVLVYHTTRRPVLRGATEPLDVATSLQMQRYLRGLGYPCDRVAETPAIAKEVEAMQKAHPQSFLVLRVPGHAAADQQACFGKHEL